MNRHLLTPDQSAEAARLFGELEALHTEIAAAEDRVAALRRAASTIATRLDDVLRSAARAPEVRP